MVGEDLENSDEGIYEGDEPHGQDVMRNTIQIYSNIENNGYGKTDDVKDDMSICCEIKTFHDINVLKNSKQCRWRVS